MERDPNPKYEKRETGLSPEKTPEQEPKIDLDQQVKMTDKFERLMNDPEERRKFWKAFSAKHPDAAKKFEEAAQERQDILQRQKAILGKKPD